MNDLDITVDDVSRFIVVEGPIGVGKTSLAKKLADSYSGSLILEEIDNNPFLDRFYKGGRGALPAQHTAAVLTPKPLAPPLPVDKSGPSDQDVPS